MLIDTRIIERHAQYQVLAQRHEIMFRDGSAVQLHPVNVTLASDQAGGVVDTFLRALQIEGFTWVVFDLRHVVRDIDADLLGAHWHDSPGIVFFTLRLAFANAADMLAAVKDAPPRATWWHNTMQAVAA